ncbi:MAG: aldo/keto reductase [Pseudomonadota bacterium]
MEKRRLGRTDLSVSVLCLGTMMYGDQINEADAAAQMDRCLEREITFFDTAELYTIPPKPETQGESERIVGRWIKARGVRDKIILASKITGRSSMPWLRDGDETRLTAAQIKAAIERSLTNLETDYLDLYQTHWPDRRLQLFGGDLRGFHDLGDDAVALEETLSAMTDLQREGKIRHFGLSNETSWGVMRHLAVADAHSFIRPQSIQNGYSLINRTFETGLAEIALREGVGLLAYSPIGQGALTGKYLNGATPPGSRGALYQRMQRYETPSADDAIRAYLDIAKDAGADPAALAMQFVTTRPFVTSNIFGARTVEQLETILSSLDLEWTQDLEAGVNNVHARLPNPCP